MSEWWPFIAAFWAWYLVDCFKISLRPRFLLSRFFGRKHGRVVHTNLGITAPTPFAWHVLADDVPFSFSPEGLSNIPIGSAGRPAPLPEVARAWKWEDIRQLAQKRGRVYINGQDFCAVTPLSSLPRLRTLIDGARSRTPEQRQSWLSLQISLSFRPAHLRRQHTALIARTQNGVLLSSIFFILALVISAYVLAHGPEHVSPLLARQLAQAMPRLAWYLTGLHVVTIVFGWMAHRRLMKKKGEARLNLLMSALFLPPQALRLRARIGAEYFHAAHPLAWIAAVGSKSAFIHFARQTLADLRWPIQPISFEDPALSTTISDWMRGRVSLEIDRLLKLRGTDASQLLKAPAADGPTSCTYCPRCLSQFKAGTSYCPHGIKLQALK